MGPAPVTGELDVCDVQGLVVRGYGTLREAAYLVLHASDPHLARRWLASTVEAVTGGAERPARAAVNVAFTAAGLRRLGVRDDVLGGLAPELRQGMAEPSRARALGDVGPSAPTRWAWGGPRDRPPHALLLLYASDPTGLRGLVAQYGSPPGMDVLARLDTADLGGREHFGFRDGISQPLVEGLSRTGHADHRVKAGEFVLGCEDEYGQRADVPDLAVNGTYLVLRQLRQDVEGFWRFCREATADASDHEPGAAVALAARIVGRWPGGAPLALSPDHDDPDLAAANDFRYVALDPDGLRCPLGAHVRRANPRDSLGPDPGSDGAVDRVRRHRILRRGRPYGVPGGERGLHFLCLNANLARQFEFLQRTWIANPRFNGLYDDADPLVGPRGPRGATLTIQGAPVRRRYRDLPAFVTTRGGAYFLLPGVRALRHLARGGP